LTEDEIQKMVKDAEANADSDTKRKEAVTERNKLDSLVWQTEKNLGEHKEKMEAGDVEALEKALADAKEKLKSEDGEELKAAYETLMQASHKLAEVLYKQQQPNPEGGPAADGSDPAAQQQQQEKQKKQDDDGVIDAEVVD
jgi:molecular chaperone DnaK